MVELPDVLVGQRENMSNTRFETFLHRASLLAWHGKFMFIMLRYDLLERKRDVAPSPDPTWKSIACMYVYRPYL